MRAPERTIHVGAAISEPVLSVLTPFHKHDPSALIAAIERAPANVEFILLDDASNDTPLLARVISALNAAGASARIIVLGVNGGRSAARNRLLAEARGDYVLFLDADMIPDNADCLDRWLDLIETQAPNVAFGGLSLKQALATPETALHYNIFAHSDCRGAAERTASPAQFTASANLLVRRAFLSAHPFDADFAGWGFEDTDWALNAARHTQIVHVDIPATHAGLDSVQTLLRKSVEAGPNFALLARKHPAHVARFAAHRAARALRSAPGREHVRTASAWIARNYAAPMSLRRAALKLYRASHYAEHLS
jgi:glycosyltransferase involved in cell wall biosynthesis